MQHQPRHAFTGVGVGAEGDHRRPQCESPDPRGAAQLAHHTDAGEQDREVLVRGDGEQVVEPRLASPIHVLLAAPVVPPSDEAVDHGIVRGRLGVGARPVGEPDREEHHEGDRRDACGPDPAAPTRRQGRRADGGRSEGRSGTASGEEADGNGTQYERAPPGQVHDDRIAEREGEDRSSCEPQQDCSSRDRDVAAIEQLERQLDQQIRPDHHHQEEHRLLHRPRGDESEQQCHQRRGPRPIEVREQQHDQGQRQAGEEGILPGEATEVQERRAEAQDSRDDRGADGAELSAQEPGQGDQCRTGQHRDQPSRRNRQSEKPVQPGGQVEAQRPVVHGVVSVVGALEESLGEPRVEALVVVQRPFAEPHEAQRQTHHHQGEEQVSQPAVVAGDGELGGVGVNRGHGR